MCSVFLESNGKVSSGFPNVNLTTFTWNAVNSCMGGGILLVLVGLERAMEFLGSIVIHLDSCLLEDTLEMIRGTYVW